MTLEGRVAIVTGSGRNIGRATALELARRGASVVVNARTNRQEADAVVAEIEAAGGSAVAAIADVGDQAQVNAMVAQALDAFGKVDILVNNAGLRADAPIAHMTTAQWRAAMAVNLDGPFYCAQAVVPGMVERGWGRIINVSGLNAFKGRAGWAHVCASKMGALGLTRALAAELAEHGVLVNHIVPGAFDTTPPPSDPSSGAAQSPVGAPGRADGIPLGRLGLPQEIATTCAFLASDDASFITGQTIHVNGGALAY